MGQEQANGCGCGTGGCGSDAVRVDRRGFLTLAALAPFAGSGRVAGPFETGMAGAEDFERYVPSDKKLDAGWVRGLAERTEPEVYRGEALRHVGMPVGGIGCGQLYLGGDGRLWYWDIFGDPVRPPGDAVRWQGPHYKTPLEVKPEVRQGFFLRTWLPDGAEAVNTLDGEGWEDVTFRGEYPIGRVSYRKPRGGDVALEVDLEAFSPFCPLDVANSSLPATVFRFRVKNTSNEARDATLTGWIENPVCRGTKDAALGRRVSEIETGDGLILLRHGARRPERPVEALRPDIVLADFEGADYAGWTVEGEAFDTKPYRAGERGRYGHLTGFAGEGFVNSHRMRQGEDSETADRYRGTLTSPEFEVNRRYLALRVGGGDHPGKTGVQLLVEGKVVREARGRNEGGMRREVWDLGDLEGRKARVRILDEATGGWGHVTADHLVLTDAPEVPFELLPALGTLALGIVGAAAEAQGCLLGEGVEGPEARAVAAGLMDVGRDGPYWLERTFDRPIVGAVGRQVRIGPGETVEFTAILAWHFPYFRNGRGELDAITKGGYHQRHYARRFADARAVARHVAAHWSDLADRTRLWNRTWYDSSLPHWLLDRTLVTVDCLATATFLGLSNGRWWGWEGVECCPGTCQHVWHYAQGAARLFPEIERDLRERVDFGLAWRENGAIDYRAEHGREVAHDGLAGTIVRVYREHTMAPDAAFLQRVWPRVRKTLEYLMAEDQDGDGLLEGRQYNTLDAAWFGPMGWISSVYLAALAAGEKLAEVMGDAETAARCRARLTAGEKRIVELLFNGEYFIHIPDPGHPEATATGKGCHIDQVLGQSLAHQVGLRRVVPRGESGLALRALWRYNFAPDVGVYRRAIAGKLPEGRWYAMPGEAGLLMCTWPRGGIERAGGEGNPTFVGYFMECMTGFEYQVAAHMVAEGLVTEGLAVARAIHERYGPARRNPYNEVECSDHYARAMASFGVYLTACGYRCDGPAGVYGFAPKVRPEGFRGAFVGPEGWGTFEQRIEGNQMTARLEPVFGSVRIRTLELSPPRGAQTIELETPGMLARIVKGEQTGGVLSIPCEARVGQLLRLQSGEALAVTLELEPGWAGSSSLPRSVRQSRGIFC